MVANLAVALYGLAAHVGASGFPRLGPAELEWVGDRRAPFLLACSIFGTQSFVSFVLMYIMKHMRELAECWGTGFLHMLQLYTITSSAGAIMYLLKYWSVSHISIAVDGVGDYLFMRNVHWLFSTPIQWYVFCQVCTKSNWQDMRLIYLSTVLTHVFGILMYFVKDQLRWFCFGAGIWYFLESFWRAFRLPLQKDMEIVGGRLRITMLVVWCGFPAAVLLRWYGVMGAWEEQVLSFSVLDVVAKSVTFSAIIVSRVVLSLARINGTVQLVLSSHDVTLAVDGMWQLLEDTASSSVIATYFGESSDNLKIIDLCINEEHRDRLIEAARVADSQSLGEPTPKVTVAFRLPTGGGEMLSECLVSKCLHGRRIIGIAVTSQVGNVYSWQNEYLMDEGTELAPSEISMSSVQSRNFDVQMKLALHNCNDVLQLSETSSRMVNNLFMQTHTACAMFAWEQETGAAPAIVAASPRLQAVFFQGAPMPQPLASLASGETLDRMLLALQAEDVIVHQWQGVQMPVGCAVEMTMLPLTRMSSVNYGVQVHLCVLVMVMADAGEKASQHLGYLCWKRSGDQLVCVEALSSKAQELSPPRLLQPLIQSYLDYVH